MTLELKLHEFYEALLESELFSWLVTSKAGPYLSLWTKKSFCFGKWIKNFLNLILIASSDSKLFPSIRQNPFSLACFVAHFSAPRMFMKFPNCYLVKSTTRNGKGKAIKLRDNNKNKWSLHVWVGIGESRSTFPSAQLGIWRKSCRKLEKGRHKVIKMLLASVLGPGWVIFSFNDFLNAAQCSSKHKSIKGLFGNSESKWKMERKESSGTQICENNLWKEKLRTILPV